MKLTDAFKELAELTLVKQRMIERHKEESQEIGEKIRLLTIFLKMTSAGLDVEKVRVAKTVIYVQGIAANSKGGDNGTGEGVRTEAVNDAIQDLIKNCPYMRNQYIGVKNYVHFGDQREDHKYGYGPKYGSTVFSIGLKQEVMDRPLTDEEIEAAIYYLNSIRIIQSTEMAGAK
jgi:hypothetical protein